MKQILGIIVVAGLFLTACDDGGRGKNRKLQEAAKIHENVMEKHDSIFSALEREKERIENLLSSGSVTAERKSAYESMLRGIDKSFGHLNDWEASVLGVPGFEHAHDESHGHHSHDHADEDLLKRMSDQEILELQQAYRTRLADISKQIRGLLTTIEMYEENAQ